MMSVENAIRYAKDYVVFARELLHYANDLLKEEGKELENSERKLLDLLEKYKSDS